MPMMAADEPMKNAWHHVEGGMVAAWAAKLCSLSIGEAIDCVLMVN